MGTIDKGNGVYLTQLPFGVPVAGENAFMYTSRKFVPGRKPGIIYFAGKSAGFHNIVGAGWVQELARRGYPAICGDLGDVNSQMGKVDGPSVWGCDAALAKADAIRQWAIAQGIFKNAKIHVAGGSHGCIGAYAYARNYSAYTSSISCGIGTIDVDDIYINNRGPGGGYTATIINPSAYGSDAGWQAAKATHNPVSVIPFLVANQIPMLDYYAPDDAICVNATHVAAKAAAGSWMDQYSMGNVGHSFVGIGPIFNSTGQDLSKQMQMADWVESTI